MELQRKVFFAAEPGTLVEEETCIGMAICEEILVVSNKKMTAVTFSLSELLVRM